MKAEEVIITHDADERESWEPRIEKLPAVVRRDLDKGLNREEKKIRQRATVKALLYLVRNNDWEVCRRVYDDKRDEARYTYKCV